MTFTQEQEATIRELAKHEWFHEILCISWAVIKYSALACAIICGANGWLIFGGVILCLFTSWETPLNKYFDSITPKDEK